MLNKALINAAALSPTGGALTTGSSAQAGYGFGWAFDRPIGLWPGLSRAALRADVPPGPPSGRQGLSLLVTGL